MNPAPRVLITGGGGGIGRAIARRLGADGFAITIHYHRNESAATKLTEQIRASGAAATTLAFDVGEGETVRARLEAEINAHGAYWGIVVNAGITADGLFAAMSPGDWRRVMRTDLDGFYNVVQPLIMPMVRLHAGGRIVVISSLAGQTGNPGQVNYSAAKAGLIGATKALAVELASRAITVNCVAPGLIETDMTRELALDELKARIPARRLGTPEEVAAVVGFLFSPGAAYLTRQVIGVNGGLL